MPHTKRVLKQAQDSMAQFGIDPLRLLRALKGLPAYLKEYFEFKQQLSRSGNGLCMGRLYPVLQDRFEQAGATCGHYFHQDLLVAKKISENSPVKHVDVGSRVDGFVAHVACFRKIECFDLRQMQDNIPNITFKQIDLMSNDFGLREYCDSVSSLHAIEHFGLGRYGDRIDVNGHLTGLANIYKMLKRGGKFYFSVPMGEQRVEFNAHRVFCLKYLIKLVAERYKIDSFSYVDDSGELFRDVQLSSENIANNCSCNYGCGIFELTKI